MTNVERFTAMMHREMPGCTVQVDIEEVPFFRARVTASQFQGLNYVERIYRVLDLMEAHLPDLMGGELAIRLEVYTPEGYAQMQAEAEHPEVIDPSYSPDPRSDS